MDIIKSMFNRNNITCPRCLGKGHVDWDDIERLNKKLKWRPGDCAYCKRRGKVSSKLLNKVPFDRTYLTVDLTSEERRKVMENDVDALQRGLLMEKKAEAFIQQVRFLNTNANMNPKMITDFFLIPEHNMTDNDKAELLDYIMRIIEQ